MNTPDQIPPYTYRAITSAQGAMLQDVRDGLTISGNATRNSLVRRKLINYGGASNENKWYLTEYGKWMLTENLKRLRTNP